MARRATTSGKPHDYQADVRNVTYKEAEQRVYEWLVAQGKTVTDDRPRRTFHDFTVGSAWTLDVKCDTRGYTSGAVAWEQGLDFHNGRLVDGWGEHKGLSYVAYVLLPPEEVRETVRWPVVVCHAGKLRDFVRAHREEPVCYGFRSRGTDRDGFGYVLNLDALRAFGAVVQEGVV